jgi:hypothetical protein
LAPREREMCASVKCVYYKSVWYYNSVPEVGSSKQNRKKGGIEKDYSGKLCSRRGNTEMSEGTEEIWSLVKGLLAKRSNPLENVS